MRPTLNILSEELIERILAEAKRILAETGMEIRGERMRQRLHRPWFADRRQWSAHPVSRGRRGPGDRDCAGDLHPV